MHMSLVIASCTLAAFASANPIGTYQSTAVKGTILCKSEPAKDIKLKLFDHDKLSADDKMAQGTANADGTFSISGRVSGLLQIKPELHIKHKCGHWTEHCYKIKVPGEFVTKGSSPESTFDAGTINLETVKANC